MEEFKGIDEEMLFTKKERAFLLSILDDVNCYLYKGLTYEKIEQLKEKINYFHK